MSISSIWLHISTLTKTLCVGKSIEVDRGCQHVNLMYSYKLIYDQTLESTEFTPGQGGQKSQCFANRTHKGIGGIHFFTEFKIICECMFGTVLLHLAFHQIGNES